MVLIQNAKSCASILSYRICLLLRFLMTFLGRVCFVFPLLRHFRFSHRIMPFLFRDHGIIRIFLNFFLLPIRMKKLILWQIILVVLIILLIMVTVNKIIKIHLAFQYLKKKYIYYSMNLTSDQIQNCLQSKENYKKLTQTVSKIAECDESVYHMVCDAIEEVLNDQNATIAQQFLALQLARDTLNQHNQHFAEHFSNTNCLRLIFQIAKSQKGPPKQVATANLINYQAPTQTDNLIRIALEEIKVWARWYPLTLNQMISKYSECYKQLINSKVQFPNEFYHFSEQDVMRFTDENFIEPSEVQNQSRQSNQGLSKSIIINDAHQSMQLSLQFRFQLKQLCVENQATNPIEQMKNLKNEISVLMIKQSELINNLYQQHEMDLSQQLLGEYNFWKQIQQDYDQLPWNKFKTQLLQKDQIENSILSKQSNTNANAKNKSRRIFDESYTSQGLKIKKQQFLNPDTYKSSQPFQSNGSQKQFITNQSQQSPEEQYLNQYQSHNEDQKQQLEQILKQQPKNEAQRLSVNEERSRSSHPRQHDSQNVSYNQEPNQQQLPFSNPNNIHPQSRQILNHSQEKQVQIMPITYYASEIPAIKSVTRLVHSNINNQEDQPLSTIPYKQGDMSQILFEPNNNQQMHAPFHELFQQLSPGNIESLMPLFKLLQPYKENQFQMSRIIQGSRKITGTLNQQIPAYNSDYYHNLDCNAENVRERLKEEAKVVKFIIEKHGQVIKVQAKLKEQCGKIQNELHDNNQNMKFKVF